MKLEVLVSCMHQKDVSLVARSNIQTDVLIVNQCDEICYEESEFINKQGRTCKIRMFCTTERGLSRSRNMAIKNAMGDVCLLCDDDETFEDNYEQIIIDAFKKYPNYDILAFNLNHPKRVYPKTSFDIGSFQTGKFGSFQIAFRKNNLVTSTSFCEKMGSGTGNGGGEENKFLFDCLRKGAKIRYIPSLIASIAQEESQWFNGFTKKYWIDRGWTAKMIYGIIYGYAYLWYTVLLRAKSYDKFNSVFNIVYWMHKGFLEKR